jgi:transposase
VELSRNHICTEVSVSHANARLTFHGRKELIRRVVEQGRPVAHVVVELNCSRATGYKWLKRFREEGLAGLLDRPSHAHHHPRRTAPELEAQILKLRQERKLGPARIGPLLGLAPSTVHAALTRHGLHRLAWMDRPTGGLIRRYERGRRALEELDLHVLDADLTTEPDEFGPLIAGEGFLQPLVDVGLVHPVPQAALADPKFSNDLCDRLLPQAHELDRPSLELGPVWCWHWWTPLRDESRLRTGVRTSGSGSSRWCRGGGDGGGAGGVGFGGAGCAGGCCGCGCG